MTYDEASRYMLPWGKYAGRVLDDVASTDEGLRYLDWLVGSCRARGVRAALEAYLADSTIKGEVERALAERKR
jgi:hypothetical protein